MRYDYDGAGALEGRRWLLADERGSIYAHADEAGAIIQINTYDEYGRPGDSNQGRFGYTGQIWLAEAGLYHYKARAYHAELGVFMQSDPIGHSGGINLYAYVGGDPVNATDPWGLRACKPGKDCITVYGQRFISIQDRTALNEFLSKMKSAHAIVDWKDDSDGEESDCDGFIPDRPGQERAVRHQVGEPDMWGDVTPNQRKLQSAVNLAARYLNNSDHQSAIQNWNRIQDFNIMPRLVDHNGSYDSRGPDINVDANHVRYGGAGDVAFTLLHEIGHSLTYSEFTATLYNNYAGDFDAYFRDIRNFGSPSNRYESKVSQFANCIME